VDDRHAQVKELFLRAREMPRDERARWLEESCRGDAAMRSEVESWLATEEEMPRDYLQPGAGLRLSPGSRLSHYRLVAHLGTGGMGEVWLAHDEALDRRVALKFPAPDRFRDPAVRQRLLREARAAAALEHPTVCRVFELGEVGGHAFIAMEYVEGETLAARLARGPVPLAQALSWGMAIATALDEAHGKRIVHRDLKPANVMVTTSGEVKVMDFGLARALPGRLHDGGAAWASGLTAAGTIVGTPGYMAPEEIKGEEADERADIWALGCVLYELLTGVRAFSDATPAGLIGAILYTEPLPLSARHPRAPRSLERVVRKCLAKHPKARWQSARDLRDELQRVAGEGADLAAGAAVRAAPPSRLRQSLDWMPAAMLALALVGILLGRPGEPAWWTSSRTSRTPSSSSPSTTAGPTLSASMPTLAVLPFLSLGEGARDEVLEVGMAQTVISKLIRTRRLVVRPIDIVHEYRERTRDPHAIAQALKVDFVLDGTVQRENERFRVGVQLVAASDRRVLWADTFDEGVTDIFQVQNRIAERVTGALAVELTSAERARMLRRYTDSVELYELYLRGNYSRLRLTRDGILTAIGYYKRTRARDPDYALAWEGLSQAYAMAAWWGYMSPEEVQPRIREAAQRAIAIDPDLAEAQMAFGSYLTASEWDWSGGRRALERAIQLAPTHWETHHLYANYLVMVGDLGTALAERRRAADLNPFELRSTCQLAVTLILVGRRQEALALALRIRESDPHFADNYFTLSQIYLDLGRPKEAFQALIQWHTIRKAPEHRIARLKRAFQTGGWREVRKEQLRYALELERRGRKTALSLAGHYAQLGDKDQAFLWLDRAVARREQYVVFIKSMPALAPLRSDARFSRLLRRMKLPEESEPGPRKLTDVLHGLDIAKPRDC
jgi:serine/threonine protein kinase/tetratricopeptide (TPR) repeat protein